MEVKKTTPIGVISMIILIGFAIFFIFPFYWIFTGSFKLQEVAISIPPEWFPMTPTLKNYEQLLFASGSHTLRWFFNSVFVSFMTTILVCSTAALAGYALAKKSFPGVSLIFIVFVSAIS